VEFEMGNRLSGGTGLQAAETVIPFAPAAKVRSQMMRISLIWPAGRSSAYSIKLLARLKKTADKPSIWRKSFLNSFELPKIESQS
jgi:hypothetical protein